MIKFSGVRLNVKLAFALAIAVLLAIGGLNYGSIVSYSESGRWVRHTSEVLETLEAVAFDTVNVESNMREFGLTNQDAYLGSTDASIASAWKHIDTLRELTVDNPSQQQRLKTLEAMIVQKFDFINMIRSLRVAKKTEAADLASQSGKGRLLMSDLHSMILQMEDEEQRLLRSRIAAADQSVQVSKAIQILGTALALLITGGAGWTVAHDNSRRGSAEEALRHSEEQVVSGTETSDVKYRGLLEAAPDAMVVVNRDGEIVLLNVQAEKQFGYRRDELLGQKVTNIIPVGFAERLIADGTRTTAEALEQQIGMGIELIGHRKDKTEFPIEIMLSPLESADQILVTAAIRNISVRKSAERHLAQMESKYRGLLEAAPDAMIVVNHLGEIVLLNVQAEKQFGYRRDELLAQKVTNIIPEGFAERLIADETRSTEDALAQQIGTGIELIGHRKDKSEFPIEIMLSPLEGAEGTLVTAAIRNISVRKTAEKHLAQMESKYRGLLEAAPDAMVVVNAGGEIVLLNVQAEKQFGYRRDELLGQKLTNIIPEGFAERLIADGLRSAEDARAQQIGTGIELTGSRKDGSEFPIEIMLSPLEGQDGTLVTAAIRDISVRKKAEALLFQKMQELNRSNEELGQFAYIASHDLQEPLRMVASYTQLLSKRYKGKLDKDADEFIDFAVDGARRMQQLIQDLLTYSRVVTKGKDLINISSEAALNQALMNLRGAISESGAVVTHDLLPGVFADERQLTQLFQNLVGNAIKYQHSKPPLVHIGAARNDAKKWIFSVQDNGLGIEAQYFERIFGMFQRLHKREEFDGTGIGLAICKKIVERHGSQISVESELGHGSTFRFSLAGSEIAA